MKHIFYCIILLITCQNLWAGDAAELEIIGWSEDGRYMAFEQYGVHDGSAMAYSNLYFIEAPTNRYAARPLILEDENAEEIPLETIREKNREAAAATLKKLGIETDNQAIWLAQHLFTHLDVNPHQVSFTDKIPLAGLPYETYKVTLEEAPAKAECFGMWESKKMTLTLHYPDETKQVLQADKKIPKSRGCVTSYRIHGVMLYGNNLAVFLNLSSPGFEGQNMRYLIVTGELTRG